MGEFIEVVVARESCSEEGCRGLIGLCPVDIFVEAEEGMRIDPEQVDECTLCGLCWDAEPEAVTVKRLYLDRE